MKTIVSILFFTFLISSVSAAAVGMEGSAYSDSEQFTQEESVAINMLTNAEILQGNDDGTFRTRSNLNRAEFITIAMRLLSDNHASVNLNCFPDVPTGSWYAYAVCRAKALGIVRGNVMAGVSSDNWLFAPDRAVQYEEAIKVLIGVFDIPISGRENMGDDWYVPYVQKANDLDIGLERLHPGDTLLRGEMAVLTAKFYAYVNGELDLLLNEMSGGVASSTASSSSSSSSSSNFQSSVSSTSSSSFSYDIYGSTALESNFLLLGEVTPVLASASAFSNTEPINITDVLVTLQSTSQSVGSFLVYDSNKRYLGQASLDSSIAGGKTYRLSIRNLDIQFPKRVEYSFYVRARIKDTFTGGVSGEIVEISSLGILGTGEWSSSNYSSSSTDSFPVFQTSRSIITAIANADEDNSVLVSGTNQIIGAFSFSGVTGDGQADLRVTDITFAIASVGNVTVSNVKLSADGTSDQMDCSVIGSTITCSDLDPMYGSFEDRSRVITLYADIVIPDSSKNPSLQITINQAGSTAFAGSITWTDGYTSFTWVQLGSPVSRGTRYE